MQQLQMTTFAQLELALLHMISLHSKCLAHFTFSHFEYAHFENDNYFIELLKLTPFECTLINANVACITIDICYA